VGLDFRCHQRRIGNIGAHDELHSMCRNTWFAHSHIAMEKAILLTYGAAHGLTYDQIRRETTNYPDGQELSDSTIADWYNYFREATMISLDEKFRWRGPIGGPGVVVEIDEAKIGHRKANVGRMVDGHWILGMIELDSGEIRVEILPNNLRNAQVMLPLI